MIALVAVLAQVAAVFGMWLLSRSSLRQWRLALRREYVLVRSLQTYGELLQRSVAGSLDEDELRLGMQLVDVGIRDELAAQTVAGSLRRIPRVGEPWPDSMLADVVTGE